MPDPPRCKIEGCPKIRKHRQMCRDHVRRAGIPLPSSWLCSVPGCEKFRQKRDMCHKHGRTWGTPHHICSVRGCGTFVLPPYTTCETHSGRATGGKTRAPLLPSCEQAGDTHTRERILITVTDPAMFNVRTSMLALPLLRPHARSQAPSACGLHFQTLSFAQFPAAPPVALPDAFGRARSRSCSSTPLTS